MMRFKFITYLILIGIFLCSCDKQIKTSPDGAIIKFDSLLLNVELISDNICQIVWQPGTEFKNYKSLIVDNNVNKTVENQTIYNDSTCIIQTTSLKIIIDLFSGSIIFSDKNGIRYLTTGPVNKSNFKKYQDLQEYCWSITQPLSFSTDEALYGLGQYQDGIINYKGQEVLLSQSNTCAAVPFLLSSKKYGILWDNYSRTIFNDQNNFSFFWSETADAINYYFIGADSHDRVIAGYRELTGKAPLLPQWAYGYWQSKERYKTGHELMEVAENHRKYRIPVDVIVQDWSYWGDNSNFNGMTWDKVTFPYPDETIRRLHQNYNLHLVLSVWPAFGKESAVYKEMDQKGFLLPGNHWSGSKLYDAYNPDARNLYWKYLKKAFFDQGVDGWWLDGTEPEFTHTGDRYITEFLMKKNKKNYAGSFAKYLNTYSYFSCKGVFENQLKDAPDKRVCILTRSAFAGQQKYSAITWSGDIYANWDVLRQQITAGLNFSMSGIPYWTNDIGGFFSDHWFPQGKDDPSYRELYIRWFQFSAFCPVFRSHGTNTPREIWQFSNPGSDDYDVLCKALLLRYRLFPYIYSLAAKVYYKDYTIMRGLVFDFSHDTTVYNIGNQYMFGPSIMVCPVTKAITHPQKKISEFINPDRFYSTDGKEKGMDIEFFSDTSLIPVVELKCENPNFTWLGAIPEELKDKTYQIKLKGKIKSEEKGNYQFIVNTNGSVLFKIDSTELINKAQNQIHQAFTAIYHLEAGQLYNFEIQHFQKNKNQADFSIEWITPDQQKQIFSEDKKSDIYLPDSATWYDFWTGQQYSGKQFIKTKLTIDHIPLFIKSGSILPLGPQLQYLSEKPFDPVELRIYPGNDGIFSIYEDDGLTNQYKEGIFTEINLEWKDKERQLIIGASKNTDPNLRVRTFNIIIVRPGHGIEVGLCEKPDRTVRYVGEKITVQL